MIRIALAQIDVTVGDLAGNVDHMAEWTTRAAAEGADLVVFPEGAITGYPAEDLVFRRSFVDDNLRALDDLSARTSEGPAVVAGFVDRSVAGVHNAAALLRGGRVEARYHKVKLPNFGVFDEERYFEPGGSACRVDVGGTPVGLSVCEDAWHAGLPFSAYATDEPVEVVLSINGSPYHRGKVREREDVARARAAQTRAWFVYVNMVGGQDELVFDGGSMVVSPSGEVVARAATFVEELLVVELDGARASAPPPATWPEGPEEVYRALEVGTRDYVLQNGFHDVVLGLSGGIDSAIVAVLAADALGPDSVRALAMPSRYSSPESVEDAQDLAKRLGLRLDVVSIGEEFGAYLGTLEPLFEDARPDVTEENLQARIRGTLLMAMSNKFGSIVLATGNKSEYAVGYSTLYGDMAGGFAPIKDVPKTLVYDLARWRNALGDEPVIPERILTKPPSAELRPDQRDTDSLPPYEELDPVIEAYVEDDRSPDDIIAAGTDPALVERIVGMIDHAEYKRRQAAPGVKITPKAFGRDRRLPITNLYRYRARG